MTMRIAGIALAAVTCVLSGACTSPSAPESRFATLEVAYLFIPPPGPPRDPIDAGSCAHHNAPANLRVRTSWSDETVGFTEAPGGVLRASLQARRGGEYWITFSDIRLCAIETPVVPATVSINEVLLTRTQLANGTYVFAFRVTSDGSIQRHDV